MPETAALCFSPLSPLSPSVSRSVFKSSVSHPRSTRFLRLTARASNSSNFLGDDSFPWTHGDAGIHWVQEERVTLFTSDGLIQIGGSMVPKLVTSSDKL